MRLHNPNRTIQSKHIFIFVSSFRKGRFGRVIVTAKDGDRNMIRREVFQELRILDGLIQNATAHFDGDTYTYRDVCARWENECFTNDILNLDYIMDQVSVITSHGV